MNCECRETKITEQTIHGGNTRYVKQCQNCGRSVGGAIKKSSIGFIPPAFNLPLSKYHENIRDNQIKSLCAKRESEQQRKEDAFNEKYENYMKSDLWQIKRIRVLLRDDYKCQGCLETRATEVHHKTYDRLGDELLIDLVSLCSECHNKIHKKRAA